MIDRIKDFPLHAEFGSKRCPLAGRRPSVRMARTVNRPGGRTEEHHLQEMRWLLEDGHDVIALSPFSTFPVDTF